SPPAMCPQPCWQSVVRRSRPIHRKTKVSEPPPQAEAAQTRTLGATSARFLGRFPLRRNLFQCQFAPSASIEMVNHEPDHQPREEADPVRDCQPHHQQYAEKNCEHRSENSPRRAK